MRWYANRCSSQTGHRGGRGSRCSRRSANSQKNNWSLAARRGSPRRARPLLRGPRSRHLGALGQPPATRGIRWFSSELANLRTAFRWAADHDDLDTAAAIATFADSSAPGSRIYEPISWAEELIDPARAVDHPRLACSIRDGVACVINRTDRGGLVAYAEAGQAVIRRAASRCRSASRACSAGLI